MNRHLCEAGDMAFRCLFLASLFIGLWMACRMIWGY